MKVKRQRSQKC